MNSHYRKHSLLDRAHSKDAGGTEIDADGAETEVDAEVASILGEPEVVAALDARLPVSGSEVVDLCTPTPDAPGPSAGDKRPAPDSGSQRPNRKAKMEATAKVAQCAESDRAPSREGIGEMHTFFALSPTRSPSTRVAPVATPLPPRS